MLKLREIRRRAGMNQAELAARMGVSRSAIAMWESGGSQPDLEKLVGLADLFGVSVEHLLDCGGTSPRGVRIPIYGSVAAGIPIDAVTDYDPEDPDDFVEIDAATAAGGEFAALRIKGSSMEPRFAEGDVVIVRRQPDAESGDIVIVTVGDEEATCKKLQKTPDGLMLISLNPAYAPMFYSRRECASLPVRIYGRVVELRARF